MKNWLLKCGALLYPSSYLLFFYLQANVPVADQSNLVYAAYLSSVTPARGQAAWPKIGSSNTAIVDAHGVVEISQGHRTVTVTEGSKVSQ